MTTKFSYRNTRAAKLTPSQVVEMRQKWAEGNITQAALARAYGISLVQAQRIVTGVSWSKVAMPLSGEDAAASAQRMLALQKELEEQPAGLTRLAGEIAEQERPAAAVQEMLDQLGIPARSPLDE